jgi:hypothetical protein
MDFDVSRRITDMRVLLPEGFRAASTALPNLEDSPCLMRAER